MLNQPAAEEDLLEMKSVFGFFVIEANIREVKLEDYLPQVVIQLFAAAKKLKYHSHLH